MNPSIADEERSEGLCGTVGSNKHYSPNKDDFTEKEKEFSKSWKYVIYFKEGVFSSF